MSAALLAASIALAITDSEGYFGPSIERSGQEAGDIAPLKIRHRAMINFTVVTPCLTSTVSASSDTCHSPSHWKAET